ncbi:methyltransferase domain-containing protein [Deltaproteobacteria bacterium PRO3]|nr:methyltransferase domain-containing protein [Deltaproteobacteria bacterium PRO3]
MEITEHKIIAIGRYKTVPKKKSSGAIYTPSGFAHFVANQILNEAKHLKKENKISVLDPAVGNGELLLALIQQLKNNGFKKIEATGFDTDPAAIELSNHRITTLHPEVKLSLSADDFLQSLWSQKGATLDLFFQQPLNSGQTFDLVIANPPYVRTQILGTKQASLLADKFKLDGRIDLYYAFLLSLDRILHKDSVVGIIVSNRFMTTKSGTSVRRGLWEKFSISSIWDFGDTRIFEAAVLPAVLVFKPRNRNSFSTSKPIFTSIYSTQNAEPAAEMPSFFESLNKPGIISTPAGKFEVRVGKLHFERDSSGVWRLEDDGASKWLKTVAKHTFCCFRDVGKIRVGIKTTADNVFIRSDWNNIPENERPELLRPLITHHIARRFKAESIGKIKVLYPHIIEDGRRIAVPLEQFPKSQMYLEKHRVQLEGRKYVIEAGRKWYEVWVPQDPAAWNHLKIVFRDICTKPTFWMDREGAVVNGDCYWLRAENTEKEPLLWLILAVANSKFIEAFYDHKFNNKLYACRRRFMTQYVEEFPLPNPNTPASREMIEKVKKIYDLLPNNDTENLEAEVDLLVWKSFGFRPEKV